MLTIAVTGGIASGKSTVAKIFCEKYNIPVIDSDQIAKALVDNSQEILNKISNKFGQHIVINNKLNRRELREIIFNNSEHKKWLEDLLHPLINQQIKQQVQQLKLTAQHPYCLVLIPLITKEYLLVNTFIDKVIVVDCSTEIQLARACQRDHQKEIEIKKIITNQLPREKRLELADYIIDNSKDLASLNRQIESLNNKITMHH